MVETIIKKIKQWMLMSTWRTGISHKTGSMLLFNLVTEFFYYHILLLINIFTMLNAPQFSVNKWPHSTKIDVRPSKFITCHLI